MTTWSEITPRFDVQWAIYKAGGRKVKWVFFWSHKTKTDHPTEAAFSQWYPAGFSHRGIRYATAEHWMMAAKARVFGDKRAEDEILGTTDPGKAMAMGRQVKGFDSTIWDRVAYGIVLQGTMLKFSKNKDLGTYLANTAPRILVEASPQDTVWGYGLRKDDPDATNAAKWPGRNLLGFALMEARDRFAKDDWPDFEGA